MVHMNKALAQFAITVLEVQAADGTARPMFLEAGETGTRIALVAISQDAPDGTFAITVTLRQDIWEDCLRAQPPALSGILRVCFKATHSFGSFRVAEEALILGP